MKIAVIGLWHLGTVTADCLAKVGFNVLAYDSNPEIIKNLQNKILPVNEPGLLELQKTANLKYSADPKEICGASFIWVTYDTPVDDNDHADVEYVKREIHKIIPYVDSNALILVSSQLPVGTTKALQRYCNEHFPTKNIHLAYSPENLRLGKAIEIFSNPDRIIVGVQNEEDKKRLQSVLEKFSKNIIWMSIESAEMTKHALNAFLANSVVFANELANLCEYAGANASEVEKGLKSESRIGPQAYLRAGNAFAGGTLARDVNFLTKISEEYGVATKLFPAILASNELHKKWVQHKITRVLGKNIKDKKVAMLGLTYKPDTDTLRRSEAIETCHWLHQQGAYINAYDPAIKQLPRELTALIQLQSSALAALDGADAVVIATAWPEFIALKANDFLAKLNTPIIFDSNGFLLKTLGNDKNLQYFSVGRSQ